MSIKADEVLEVLDEYFLGGDPPLLFQLWTHYFPADTRLSVFRSASEWAVICEIVCWRPGFGEPALEVFHSLVAAGTHLDRTDFSRYSAFVTATRHPRMSFAYPESPYEFCILWRDRRLEFAPTPEEYAALGIVIDDNGNEDYYGAYILRFLSEKLNHPFFSSESELRRMLGLTPQQEGAPDDSFLALVWQTREWRHPDRMNGVADEELPSRLPYFQALARAIETGDVAELQNQDPATFNTDWRIYDAQEREQEAEWQAMREVQQQRLAELPPELQEQFRAMGGRVFFVGAAMEMQLDAEGEE